VDAAGAGPAGGAAGRRGHRALAGRGLARAEKKARAERRTLLFVDESGFYLLPGLVRTYSPAGRTPVLHEWQTRDHLSVMAALTRRGRLFTLVRRESLNAAASAGFLAGLLRRSRRKLLVVWDGSPIHRGREVRDFLAGGAARRLHLEALPAYAPELNPVEGLWQQLKHVELRNVACLDLAHLRGELRLAVARLRHKLPLVRNFFHGAGLT
jgi:transposase